MIDPLVSIIAVTWSNEDLTEGHSQWQIECFITSVLAQTDPRWVLYVIHDGPNHRVREIVERFSRLDSRVIYLESEQRNGNYGHPNRLEVLNNHVKTELTHYTNADNLYVHVWLEYMLSVWSKFKSDIVCCNSLHNYASGDDFSTPWLVLDCIPTLNRIDFTNYIINTDLAKKCGLKVDYTGADGLLCDWAINGHGAKWVKIDKVLVIHQ